jgi:hypothetical protein
VLMMKERCPAIRTLRGGPSPCYKKPVLSASARSTAGCKAELIPMRETALLYCAKESALRRNARGSDRRSEERARFDR